MAEQAVKLETAGFPDAATCIAAIANDRSRDAFIALFVSAAPRLKGYLLSRGVPAESAEKVVEDTFVEVWRTADQFDPSRKSAMAWLYVIARSLWADRIGRCPSKPRAPRA